MRPLQRLLPRPSRFSLFSLYPPRSDSSGGSTAHSSLRQMPPKKHSKPLADDATSPEPGSVPTAVSVVSDGPPPTKHVRCSRSANTPSSSYESPLKKLKRTMNQHPPHKIIDSIDALRDFIKNNDTSRSEVHSSIRIQARVLWFAADTIGEFHFLRLYLGEQQAPEPLQQQQREFQAAQREDAFEANQYLITVSLYEVAPDDPNVPAPGAVISFSPTKMGLYRNCCQLNAKLSTITTVNVP